MNKIKELTLNIWEYIVLGSAFVISVLLYILNLKNKELEAVKAKIELVKTQKEADALEAEILQKLLEKDLTKKELETLKKSLDFLDQKRQNLKKEGDLSDSKIEDYWDNKK